MCTHVLCGGFLSSGASITGWKLLLYISCTPRRNPLPKCQEAWHGECGARVTSSELLPFEAICREVASLQPSSLAKHFVPTVQNHTPQQSKSLQCDQALQSVLQVVLSNEIGCEASSVWFCAGHCGRTRRLLLWGCLRATPSRAPETKTLR